jgi:hypothetical protein
MSLSTALVKKRCLRALAALASGWSRRSIENARSDDAGCCRAQAIAVELCSSDG